jgi:hypothetical protein
MGSFISDFGYKMYVNLRQSGKFKESQQLKSKKYTVIITNFIVTSVWVWFNNDVTHADEFAVCNLHAHFNIVLPTTSLIGHAQMCIQDDN